MITQQEIRGKILQRFCDKVKFGEPEECWEWQANLNNKGYGFFTPRTAVHSLAHRYIFIQLFGELPAGICVLHKCDNPKCVNPNHLFSGTKKDNMMDCSLKGRLSKKLGSCVGSQHGLAKLNEEKVIAIRLKLSNGGRATRTKVSVEYNVSRALIDHIANGKIWKHIL